MKTKIEILEAYWSEHGVASTPFAMAGELRKRFPNKKGSYFQDAMEFLKRKKQQLLAFRCKESILMRFFDDVMNAFCMQVEMHRSLYNTNIRWEPVIEQR